MYTYLQLVATRLNCWSWMEVIWRIGKHEFQAKGFGYEQIDFFVGPMKRRQILQCDHQSLKRRVDLWILQDVRKRINNKATNWGMPTWKSLSRSRSLDQWVRNAAHTYKWNDAKPSCSHCEAKHQRKTLIFLWIPTEMNIFRGTYKIRIPQSYGARQRKFSH